jgi:hypothetical protein
MNARCRERNKERHPTGIVGSTEAGLLIWIKPQLMLQRPSLIHRHPRSRIAVGPLMTSLLVDAADEPHIAARPHQLTLQGPPLWA